LKVRVGLGFDSHKLKRSGKLIIGGVTVSEDMGVEAHSDGDVLCHAIIDALLGALNIGDIGSLFPDDDPSLKGVSSLKLLEKVYGMVKEKGFSIVNLDSVIVLQEPKIKDYKEHIIRNLSSVLGLEEGLISVKGKRPEGSFPSEGISSICVVLLMGDG